MLIFKSLSFDRKGLILPSQTIYSHEVFGVLVASESLSSNTLTWNFISYILQLNTDIYQIVINLGNFAQIKDAICEIYRLLKFPYGIPFSKWTPIDTPW